MEKMQKFCYFLTSVDMEESLMESHHFMCKTKLMVVLHKHEIMTCIWCHQSAIDNRLHRRNLENIHYNQALISQKSIQKSIDTAKFEDFNKSSISKKTVFGELKKKNKKQCFQIRKAV